MPLDIQIVVNDGSADRTSTVLGRELVEDGAGPVCRAIVDDDDLNIERDGTNPVDNRRECPLLVEGGNDYR